MSQNTTFSKTKFDLQKLARPNILALKPYSSARDEYKKKDIDSTQIDASFSSAAPIFLDANENSLGSPLSAMVSVDYNRYPDPHQRDVKLALSKIKNTNPNQIFLGNGSDEAIDLLFRIFCAPQKDNVIICPPTYGMYSVSASINDTEVRKAMLTPSFELDFEAIQEQIDENTKLIFVCSPNNPTGNLLNRDSILELAQGFDGIVVIDEAYIDFAENAQEVSFVNALADLPNIVVLQTFSKAWGMAALRLGMAFASEEIIELFKKVKPPYNINSLTQKMVLKALSMQEKAIQNVQVLNWEKEQLIKSLSDKTKFSFIDKIYPSDTNFILFTLKKKSEATQLYNFLVAKNEIVVRNRSKEPLCEGGLRVTVGTPEENEIFLKTLEKYASQSIAKAN